VASQSVFDLGQVANVAAEVLKQHYKAEAEWWKADSERKDKIIEHYRSVLRMAARVV
jgi:hypothetical protein